jgi:H+/Cl- antiporter ClcA
LVTRRTAPSKAWQSAAVGVLAGLLSQFFSRAVESLPQSVQPIAGAASSLHVFVRVFIIGLALGIASLVFLGAPKDKHAA